MKSLTGTLAALAVLSHSAAHAQQTMTNTVATTYVYPLSAAITNDAGFIWNVSQTWNAEPGDIAWAESQLAGEQGTNDADPNQTYSSALGAATVPGNPDLPITFIIPSSYNGGNPLGINFSIAGPGDCGDSRPDLPCEDGMVGTPGNPADPAGGNDNIAAEALTYLALPEGLVTMGVTSDDGFQLQIGAANPADRYSANAEVLEYFNGGRSHTDSIVTFKVAKAGLYAARLLYYQGGGNASVEWYSFPAAGTTNTTLGSTNTGANAVLIGDTEDSGIAAYYAITNTVSLASYVSSFTPSPGSIGIPIVPTINATIVYGSVPVSGITLTIDGTAVTPSIATTPTNAVISYASPAALANLASHTAVLTWNDDGVEMSVTSSFSTQGYVTLSPALVVTPNTNKPGFKFNIYANYNDTLTQSSLGVQGGESDFLDNTELGLNGLVPDGNGGFLPNMADPTQVGAAMGTAPALGGPNAPAEFIVTNALNLNAANGNVPGFPALDGGNDPSHSEVLTYVYLPNGLTTFTLALDGYFRAFMGDWDYINAIQVASVYNVVKGNSTFSVFTTQAGYYPLRITVFNLDGTLSEALYTLGTNGANVAVGDVAHGGLPAFYSLAAPSKPYVRYASPRPVPHQMEYPYNRVLLRIQDRDSTVNASSAVFNLDGKNVTITNDTVGDVVELTWNATTLQTPAEIHTGLLTYKDNAGNSLSNAWTFQNLKAVYLPTAMAGYWLPTNAFWFENFSEYPDPTEFDNNTNNPTGYTNYVTPTGNWYLSPQPENPLVDIAPIWTNVPAGPAGWYIWNFSAPGESTWDATDPNSLAYASFLCVDLNTFSGIEGDCINTAPGEMINGQPLQALVYDPSQNVLIAESDNRSGQTSGLTDNGQNQFAISKRIDLTGCTNPVIAFAAIQKQNQDNLNSMEYSPDGGVTWAPIIYYLDGHSVGDTGDAEDLQINTDTTVNVNNTLFHDQSPGEIPIWTDDSGNVNNTFGSSIAAPISQALAPFFAPRVNDDKFDGKRIEVVRMPLAANKSDVRLRLSQIASCSWYFGVSQIAIFDVAPSGAIVPTGVPPANAPTLSISHSSGHVTITWTGTGTLQSATKLTGKPSDWTAVSPAPTGNSYTVAETGTAMFFRVVSN